MNKYIKFIAINKLHTFEGANVFKFVSDRFKVSSYLIGKYIEIYLNIILYK